MAKRTKHARYAAKLLFQFRVVIDGVSSKRRICQESIINFTASSPKAALKHALKRGKAREADYLNDEGNPVYFEFVGVLDLQDLGAECEPDEVWYGIKEMLMPMERREKLIPADNLLRSPK